VNPDYCGDANCWRTPIRDGLCPIHAPRPAPTSDEVAARLIAWRTIRRLTPPDDHRSVVADAMLADLADRLEGLGVAK
jgi:hypothetical protein